VGTRQHNHEFLTSPTPHKVSLARLFGQQPAKRSQHLVARGVSMPVVDQLKVVDVEQQE